MSTPSEVSGKWWMPLSRLMNTHNGLFVGQEELDWFIKGVVDDVFGWTGGRLYRRDLMNDIKTPVSMGVLGVYEFASVSGKDNIFVTRITSIFDEKTFGDEKFVGCSLQMQSRKLEECLLESWM